MTAWASARAVAPLRHGGERSDAAVQWRCTTRMRFWIAGRAAEPRDLRREKIIAPAGMRNSYSDDEPCRTIGLRELTVSTTDTDYPGSRPPIHDSDKFEINSTATGQRLTIRWRSTGASRVEEISYLAIGPVSPPEPGPYQGRGPSLPRDRTVNGTAKH